jgi:hypothetical protein
MFSIYLSFPARAFPNYFVLNISDSSHNILFSKYFSKMAKIPISIKISLFLQLDPFRIILCQTPVGVAIIFFFQNIYRKMANILLFCNLALC